MLLLRKFPSHAETILQSVTLCVASVQPFPELPDWTHCTSFSVHFLYMQCQIGSIECTFCFHLLPKCLHCRCNKLLLARPQKVSQRTHNWKINLKCEIHSWIILNYINLVNMVTLQQTIHIIALFIFQSPWTPCELHHSSLMKHNDKYRFIDDYFTIFKI